MLAEANDITHLLDDFEKLGRMTLFEIRFNVLTFRSMLIEIETPLDIPCVVVDVACNTIQCRGLCNWTESVFDYVVHPFDSFRIILYRALPIAFR